MAKHKFNFRTYATDDSQYWDLTDSPLAGLPVSVFGVYFIAEGEATHICSMTPSSRAEFLQNEFVFPSDLYDANGDLPADVESFRDEHTLDAGDQWTQYLGYVDCTAPRQRDYISDRYSCTLDSRDYELNADDYAATVAKSLRYGVSLQQAHADARREGLREHAYQEAREYFQGNWTFPPVLCGGAAWTRHAAKVARRRAEPLPLFPDAPLHLAPSLSVEI